MTETIPYNQTVFIGYQDKAMTVECMRAYPTDMESYYECMDVMIEHYNYWKSADRRTIKSNGQGIINTPLPSPVPKSNNRLLIDQQGNMIYRQFEQLQDDYLGY